MIRELPEKWRHLSNAAFVPLEPEDLSVAFTVLTWMICRQIAKAETPESQLELAMNAANQIIGIVAEHVEEAFPSFGETVQ